MREIASNSMYCNKGNYQAACCTTKGNAMALYDKCSWTEQFPMCAGGMCAASQVEVARSGTGSGDVMCVGNWEGHAWAKSFLSNRQERKYCCNDQVENSRW